MDTRVFQEAIRSATVTYPILFVFGVLLLFALLRLGGSMIAADWLRVLFAVLGSAATVSAIALVAYAIRFRPEMLRSERHVLSMRVAQMMGDKDMDPATRERLSHMVIDAEDRPRQKYPPRPKGHGSREDDTHGV